MARWVGAGQNAEVPLAPGTVTLPLCSRPNAGPLGLQHDPIPDRSPGDFHSTGASYDPRKDSQGTKPVAVARTRYIKGRQALREKYITTGRSIEMVACIMPDGHPRSTAAIQYAHPPNLCFVHCSVSLTKLHGLPNVPVIAHAPAALVRACLAASASFACRALPDRLDSWGGLCSRRGDCLLDRYAARDVEPEGRDHGRHQRERRERIESAGKAAG